MKRILLLASFLTVVGLSLKAEDLTFTVKGVTFTMVRVEGGTFTMGATDEQIVFAQNDESPTHDVTLSTYCIGQTEVTQELWKAVMGSVPSRVKGKKLPAFSISWNDCMKFIDKLRELTGKDFRLPTEAEWEFAARGGNQSMGYRYSGSDKIDDVAWYEDNSMDKAQDVAKKKPNELGIYDMSGNVKEWCMDQYWKYTKEAQNNPVSNNGPSRVLRGGSYAKDANQCRVTCRSSALDDDWFYNVGFRLALSEGNQEGTYAYKKAEKYITKPFENIAVKATETFNVNGVSFTMIGVDGGTFTMGATPEQGKDAQDNEKPSHEVSVNSFQIGQTEVTQALWNAVMGNNPSYFQGDDHPVECVNPGMINAFIVKLNKLTGKNFRLPTEAEWEYAARGGSKTQHFKYSGSNKVDEIAWFEKNASNNRLPRSEFGTHPVAKKAPNELGLYDMSGNVTEWCADDSYDYDPEPLSNPLYFNMSNKANVLRGGSWRGKATGCRVTQRSLAHDEFTVAYVGFRLAL